MANDHVTSVNQEATAILAGGCFWCMESDLEKVPGIVSVTSGYTGGHVDNPDYHQVSAGQSGHVEAVQVRFDPARISYQQLLDRYWHLIDPTTDQGQFCDQGSQYRPVIFYHGAEQQRVAEASLAAVVASKPFADAIKVALLPASVFYPAEEYHQDYHQKNPLRYRFYRYSCGRDQRLEELWGPHQGADS